MVAALAKVALFVRVASVRAVSAAKTSHAESFFGGSAHPLRNRCVGAAFRWEMGSQAEYALHQTIRFRNLAVVFRLNV